MSEPKRDQEPTGAVDLADMNLTRLRAIVDHALSRRASAEGKKLEDIDAKLLRIAHILESRLETLSKDDSQYETALLASMEAYSAVETTDTPNATPFDDGPTLEKDA